MNKQRLLEMAAWKWLTGSMSVHHTSTSNLTRTLAEAAEANLKIMGDDVKFLSWFSSSAEKRAKEK